MAAQLMLQGGSSIELEPIMIHFVMLWGIGFTLRPPFCFDLSVGFFPDYVLSYFRHIFHGAKGYKGGRASITNKESRCNLNKFSGGCMEPPLSN